MTSTRTITQLLGDWRAAERAWADGGTDTPALALDVVHTWMAYQEATCAQAGLSELIVVTDVEGRIVACSDSSRTFLGAEPAEILGLRPRDITAPDLADLTPEVWMRFLQEGSMSGPYRLQHRDGSVIPTQFRARAHDPIPGHHSVRHRAPPA